MSTGLGWAVEVRGFAKSFVRDWRGGRVEAVREISFTVAPGKVLGLLGPNGSGKSTTLKALAGLLTPTQGECFIGGHPAGHDRARAQVGYLPESPRFAPHLTGREFLGFCAGLSALDATRVEAALAWSGLGSAAERRMATYSNGMRQRVGLAQAILHDPAVLLLDEPTGGLDPGGRLDLGRLIRELAARGKTVLFSSHLLAQAEALCDQIVMLGHGRLLAAGTPEELLGTRGELQPQPSRLEELYLEKMRHHE